MQKRKIKQNKNAVSEVLDTILLLGMAVALFSVVSAVVLSFPFNPSTPSTDIMGYINGDDIVLEHQGGENLDLDTKIQVAINSTDFYTLVASDLLSDESKNNNLWNIGEKVIIDATSDLPISVNLSVSRVDITVIDINSNSVVLMGLLNERKIVELSEDQFFIDVDIIGSGVVEIVPEGPYYDGETVELTAIPDPDWNFFEWSGDVNSNDNPLIISVNEDKAITARFTQTNTLILRPNDIISFGLERFGGNNFNYECVYEVNSDENETYVYSINNSGLFQTDFYEVEDTSQTGIITKVTIFINVRRLSEKPGSPTQDVSARTAIKIGANEIGEYGDISPDLSKSWTLYSTEYVEKDGNLGSGSWTWDDINNLGIGVSLRSQFIGNNNNQKWSKAICTQVWVEVEYSN